jgi:hypothetical protein
MPQHYRSSSNRIPGHGICLQHLDKIIFYTKEEVKEYNRQQKPWERLVDYKCPATKNHLHARNQTKRNNSYRKRKRVRKRDQQ